MAVSTTAAVIIGGGALLGAGATIMNNEAQKKSLREQKKANKRAAEEARRLSDAKYAVDKDEANKYAQDLQEQAAETQKNADISRQRETQQLAGTLSGAADESQASNLAAANLQAQGASSVASARAGVAAGGLRLVGNAAKAIKLTENETSEQVSIAKDSINNGLRTTSSGATITKQGINQEYSGNMFNKNAMLETSAEAISSYEVGGNAFKLHEASNYYDSQLLDIKNDLIQSDINSINANYGLSLITGAFNGASSALSMGGSIQNIGTSFNWWKKPAAKGGYKLGAEKWQ